MKRNLERVIATTLLLAGCATTQPNPLSLAEFLRLQRHTHIEHVRVFEGRSNSERRELLKDMLRSKGYDFRVHHYSDGSYLGENIIFEVGEGKRALVLTAHHDTYPGSPGANDDASCISSMLDAYGKLKASPPKNAKIRFIVFDQEEERLKGSKAYVNNTDLSDVGGVLSLEFCGIGNKIYVWDLVIPKIRESLLFRTVIETLEKDNIPYATYGSFGQRTSDHASFFITDIPSFGLVVLPGGISALRPFNYNHSHLDTSSTLEESAMQLMSNVVYGIVRKFDEKFSR